LGKPATSIGLDVYKALDNLHRYSNFWWVRLFCPRLKALVDAIHGRLDALRISLDRDLPTPDQCQKIGIPPIVTQGGPGGNKLP